MPPIFTRCRASRAVRHDAALSGTPRVKRLRQGVRIAKHLLTAIRGGSRKGYGEVVDTIMVTRPSKDLFGAQDAVALGLKQKLLALAALEKVK